MEAAFAFEVPAVEVRDRLAGFVEEVAARLPLRRQRENALLYVRGLVEQGGRKSLQPTLFRLEETPARYESMQQFLADSPWDPELLVRACAERVAPRDRRCRLGRRRHRDRQGRQALAGGEAAVLGHARARSATARSRSACTRSARGGRCRSGGGSTCPRSGATICERRRKAKIPDRFVFQTKPQLARRALRAGGRAGRCRRRRSWPTAPTATTPRSAPGSHELELEYVVAVRAETSVYGPETTFAVPERNGRTGRPRTVARPDRTPESVRALAERLPAKAWKTLPCRTTPAGEDVAAASRSSASSRPIRSATTTGRRARSG